MKNDRAARNFPRTICTFVIGEVSRSSMVPRRFSSAKAAIVIMGSMNKMTVLITPKKLRVTRAGTSIAGGGPPNCCDCIIAIIERSTKMETML